MSKADIVLRARVLTDSFADDVAKAYARRAPGVRGPITVKELPEDVGVEMVNTIKKAAPLATRKKMATRLSKKSYALVGGGVVTGATIFNLDDLGFIDALLSLTPDSMRELVEDTSDADSANQSTVASGVQVVGDLLYLHQMHAVDYDAEESMRPLDQTIQSTIQLQLAQVNTLQALTDLLELALNGVGSLDALEAIIMLSNNTTPEDRVALYDNLKYKRGY